MKSQRGFTTLEALVALALCFAIALATFGVLRGLLDASSATASSTATGASIERLTDDLRSDAASAFAVFVPARDVMQRANDAGSAHEVDFYAETGSGAPTFWAYYYDAAAHTLQRFDYDASGRRGEADRTNGAIDTAARYPVLHDVTSFTARTLEASDLVGPANLYGNAIAPAFAGSAPQSLPVGFIGGGGSARADLYGGNTTVQVAIATTHASRTIHLSTEALPSGFTVRADPQFRAIVYRIDQTHRFWFGLAGKSHVFVNARLDVSYDDWKTAPLRWCDYNLYGYPGGLTGGAAENYHPEWFTESAAGIVYAVTHGATPGATCPAAPPARSGAATAAPYVPPPDVRESAPPCFSAGSCWPANAPPDWSPSPAPASTPPVSWCDTHAASRLCGGPGPPAA